MSIQTADLDEMYAAGMREGVLKDLVVEYKYQSRRGFAMTLAEILEGALPLDLKERLMRGHAIVVPLPTIHRHIRERGFDHTAKMAKALARRLGLEYLPLLKRVNKTVQVGADGETRKKQAGEAYEVNKNFFATRRSSPSPRMERASTRAAALRIPQKSFLFTSTPILLVDDILTTGASLSAAAQKIRQAGFKSVSGVVVAMGLKSGDLVAAHASDGRDDEVDDGVGQHTND
ncbi:ComF family protein [Candidatus Saccharibacteria bacterium]|nr:ComF family protein [Candidatus Saccharibacteria bacterium]